MTGFRMNPLGSLQLCTPGAGFYGRNKGRGNHQSELVGDVAVPVSVRQAVLFWAIRSPDARPRLNWHKSSSTVLSQVCLGRPGRRLQFLGAGGDMQACRAREWSWEGNDGRIQNGERRQQERGFINTSAPGLSWTFGSAIGLKWTKIGRIYNRHYIRS